MNAPQAKPPVKWLVSDHCLFGADVALAYEARREASVPRSDSRPDCFSSEPLCRFQSREYFDRGIRGAEIVRSIYGCSVRSDTGLENFALLASSRHGDLDGTMEDAVRWAKAWQAEDPSRRYVWVRP